MVSTCKACTLFLFRKIAVDIIRGRINENNSDRESFDVVCQASVA